MIFIIVISIGVMENVTTAIIIITKAELQCLS